MSTSTGYGRWWESYLVRYFMPSIAGMIIVIFLLNTSPCLKNILLFGADTKKLESPILLLLFLYGNLFCYVASYPILVFHATRVLDFDALSWKKNDDDGYRMTLLVGIAAIVMPFILFFSDEKVVLIVIEFLFVGIFVTFQCKRILKVMEKVDVKMKINNKNIIRKVTNAYGFVHALALRRGVIEVRKTKKAVDNNNKKDDKANDGSKDGDDLEKNIDSEEKLSSYRGEIVETYRHMREHGNSAFIFSLEIILAIFCYSIVTFDVEASTQLILMGLLFALWAIPSVMVHMLGQHLERQFSRYDSNLVTITNPDN